ncbi:hypothetical protein ACHAQA_009849 [Verticillium albo-atrum]
MSSRVFSPIISSDATRSIKNGCNSPTADLLSLPCGFPELLTTKASWTGVEHSSNVSQYIYRLSALDIAELECGLEHFKGLGQDGDNVTRDTFPLPILGERLGKVSQDVHSGRGFAVIRGLDPEKYCVEDMVLLYLGVQVCIANQQGRQDKEGNMLGGKCIIASGHTVYNVLAKSRPDIIRTLVRSDWPFALPRFHCRPILFQHDGKMIINFGRAPLLGSAAHPRPDHLPILSARHIEALDAIEAIARATQHEIQTQAGDMHFINNLVVLHRREGFVNGEGPQEKRHLVRMILRDSELGWAIPCELQREWFDAFDKDAARAWHLEPMPEGFFPLRVNTN